MLNKAKYITGFSSL